MELLAADVHIEEMRFGLLNEWQNAKIPQICRCAGLDTKTAWFTWKIINGL